MEKQDHELIQNMLTSNPELRKLYRNHIKLDKEVCHIERYANYSPSARILQKKKKKLKLRGVESMMRIVRESSYA